MKIRLLCIVAILANTVYGCNKQDEHINQYEPIKSQSENGIINLEMANTSLIIGTNDWSSIVHGNSKYVAVNTGTVFGGCVTTSTDGITWTGSEKIHKSSLSCIAFGNGKFVAADSENNIIISADGVSWAATEQVYAYDSRDIVFGNGKFLIASYAGYLIASTDAINWSANKLGIGGWYGITFGNERFVTVGAFGYTATSTDGIVWSIPNKISKETLNSIAYNKNCGFATVGNNGYIFFSIDGITWSEHKQVGTNNWNSIVTVNDKFIVVGDKGYITTSTNGINWTTPKQLKDRFGNIVTTNLKGVCAMP